MFRFPWLTGYVHVVFLDQETGAFRYIASLYPINVVRLALALDRLGEIAGQHEFIDDEA
jgi:hypothetical protein